jgi:hypothetical protein
MSPCQESNSNLKTPLKNQFGAEKLLNVALARSGNESNHPSVIVFRSDLVQKPRLKACLLLFVQVLDFKSIDALLTFLQPRQLPHPAIPSRSMTAAWEYWPRVWNRINQEIIPRP